MQYVRFGHPPTPLPLNPPPLSELSLHKGYCLQRICAMASSTLDDAAEITGCLTRPAAAAAASPTMSELISKQALFG